MSSVNKVILVGRLGKNPELRQTASQMPVCTFSLATSEYSGGGDKGQRQEKTTWHNIVAWGKTAELASKYLAKGRLVYVEGRILNRDWQDKEGQKRTTTEIHINSLQFLEKAGSTQMSEGSSYAQEATSSMMPAMNPMVQQGAMEPAFTEDDIPF
jgi:single-strand DNA-binding protein